MNNSNSKIVFIGNFVNDVILIHKDLHLEKDQSFHDIVPIEKQLAYGRGEIETEEVTRAQALGGSVTYGSLAACTFGGIKSFIITQMGYDIIQPEFNNLIGTQVNNGLIDLSYCTQMPDNASSNRNTSYYLNYYNNKKIRNLSLMEKGERILVDKSVECIEQNKPDAILFVPVSDEMDEDTICEITKSIQQIQELQNEGSTYRPIIAFDIQGLLRCFSGTRVSTRPKHIMIQKLITISQALSGMDIISVVKAEYGEAAAIIGEHDPATCARLIRENFGFSIVSVTMGGDGGFISSFLTGEIYIPTFKPVQVTDETGCGDTFLTCTVMELLITINSKNTITNGNSIKHINQSNDTLINRNLTKEDILHCIQVGSSGASHLVEQIGPNGFANRDKILERVKNGTKQTKQHYLQYNSPNNNPIGSDQVLKPKIFKSITSYK